MPNLIDEFCEIASEIQMIAEPYKQWGVISLIGAVTGRRRWISPFGPPVYPNPYILLVGDTAAGKTLLVELIKDILLNDGQPLQGVWVCPERITWEALAAKMAKPEDTPEMMQRVGDELLATNIYLCAGETRFAMPKYDDMAWSFWCDGHLGKKATQYVTKSKGEHYVKNPHQNFLGGVQPGWFGDGFADFVIEAGYIGRFIPIWGDPFPQRDLQLFENSEISSVVKNQFRRKLGDIACIDVGEMQISKPAKRRWQEWVAGDCDPKPNSYQIVDTYNKRRIETVSRLVTIEAIADKCRKVVDEEDLAVVLERLRTAEENFDRVYAKHGAPEAVLATEIREIIRAHGGKMSKTALYSKLHGRGHQVIVNAISLAENSGFIRDAGGAGFLAD